MPRHGGEARRVLPVVESTLSEYAKLMEGRASAMRISPRSTA
jgi:hypothetical protein